MGASPLARWDLPVEHLDQQPRIQHNRNDMPAHHPAPWASGATVRRVSGDELGIEELLTSRLSLRRPTLGDVDAIFGIHHDPLACAHNPSDALATCADAKGLFRRWDDHWQRFGFGYWVVRRRDSLPQLGFCGLKFMQLQQRRILNLFYRFAPASWGDGVGSEAAAAVVKWATTQHPSYPVIARVRPENVASQRVAVRAGLVRTQHLDSQGLDGFDWIFASNWQE
jgi:[ribosomal protein S5]-alanine N-acetyltransferase